MWSFKLKISMIYNLCNSSKILRNAELLLKEANSGLDYAVKLHNLLISLKKKNQYFF